MSRFNIAFFVGVAALLCWMVVALNKVSALDTACKDAGGTFVKASTGWECIRATVVKP